MTLALGFAVGVAAGWFGRIAYLKHRLKRYPPIPDGTTWKTVSSSTGAPVDWYFWTGTAGTDTDGNWFLQARDAR